MTYKGPNPIPDNNYTNQRGSVSGAPHGAMPNNVNGTIPGGYLAAQVTSDHLTSGGNMIPAQRVADSGMNSMVNQLGGLGIHGQGPMVPPGYFTADGQYFVGYATPGVHASVPAFTSYGQIHEHSSSTYPNQFMQGMPSAMSMPMQFVPVQAGRSGIVSERSDMSTKDVPRLDNRRSSYSTTESTPATPFFGSMATRDQTAHVAVSDRSAYTTPSPQQVMANGAAQPPKGFFPISGPLNTDLDALLKRDPPVPAAVPAVFTPQENMKTLEQSLVSHIPGNRNVYIRGLHPTTDDETLKKYAERFGQVETSKAIIDNATGACKGYVFYIAALSVCLSNIIHSTNTSQIRLCKIRRRPRF